MGLEGLLLSFCFGIDPSSTRGKLYSLCFGLVLKRGLLFRQESKEEKIQAALSSRAQLSPGETPVKSRWSLDDLWQSGLETVLLRQDRNQGLSQEPDLATSASMQSCLMTAKLNLTHSYHFSC